MERLIGVISWTIGMAIVAVVVIGLLIKAGTLAIEALATLVTALAAVPGPIWAILAFIGVGLFCKYGRRLQLWMQGE